MLTKTVFNDLDIKMPSFIIDCTNSKFITDMKAERNRILKECNDYIDNLKVENEFENFFCKKTKLR